MDLEEIREAKSLQLEIHQWHEETFPEATLESVALHLLDEVRELNQAIEDRDVEGAPGEVADCIILASILQHLLIAKIAPALKVDVTEEVRKKHEINRKRKFVYNPEIGYAEHIKDDSELTPVQRAKKLGLEVVH